MARLVMIITHRHIRCDRRSSLLLYIYSNKSSSRRCCEYVEKGLRVAVPTPQTRIVRVWKSVCMAVENSPSYTMLNTSDRLSPQDVHTLWNKRETKKGPRVSLKSLPSWKRNEKFVTRDPFATDQSLSSVRRRSRSSL